MSYNNPNIWQEEAAEMLDQLLDQYESPAITPAEREQIISEVAQAFCDTFNAQYENVDDWLAERFTQKEVLP